MNDTKLGAMQRFLQQAENLQARIVAARNSIRRCEQGQEFGFYPSDAILHAYYPEALVARVKEIALEANKAALARLEAEYAALEWKGPNNAV